MPVHGSISTTSFDVVFQRVDRQGYGKVVVDWTASIDLALPGVRPRQV